MDPAYSNECLVILNFDLEPTHLTGDSLDNNGNSNPRCGDVFSMVTEQKKMFYCKPRKTGRYVNIRLLGEKQTLTLCEVAVYSESKGNVLVTQ